MSWKLESKVDVNKLLELMRNLGNVEEDLLLPVADEIAEQVKENIISKNVIDTGALLDSIHAADDNGVVVRDGVEYGIYQEFGTRDGRIAGRPFFIPALESFGVLVSKKFIELMK